MDKQRIVERGRGGVLRMRRWHRSAFTLIEVMIVLAIILILSGFVGLQVMQRRGQAQANAVKVDMNTIRNAMQMFYFDFNRYPTDEEGVAVLWDRTRLDPEEDPEVWNRYLDRPMPTDRWGSEWGYRQVSEFDDDEERFELWSFGPDRQDGTDDDIYLFEREDDEFGNDFGGQ